MADYERVPGGGAQRVDVDAGAAARRTHDEPAVGRAPPLAAVLEEVVLEVPGYLVVVQKLLTPLMLGEESERH